MSYTKPYRRTRSRPAGTARWMDLRYAGTCRNCGTAIPAGGRAFYDPRDQLICCTSLECADVYGLTKQVWHGSPISGRWVDTLSEHRMKPAVLTWKQRYGRCEDAPCCGCCS